MGPPAPSHWPPPSDHPMSTSSPVQVWCVRVGSPTLPLPLPALGSRLPSGRSPGIRQGPTRDSLASAQQLDLPSALFTLHPGWGVLNMQRAALRRRKNGVNRTDCELAKRCNALEHLGASVWHQIGSCASQGNREERSGATGTCPASQGSGLLSREWRWFCGAWSCHGPHWHWCFQKCLRPGSVETAGPKSERTEGARKPAGVAFGKGSPAGEARACRERSTFCPCLLAAHMGPSWTAPQLLSLARPLGKNVGKSYLAPTALCPGCL